MKIKLKRIKRRNVGKNEGRTNNDENGNIDIMRYKGKLTKV